MNFNNEKEVEFFYWSELKKIGKELYKDFTMTAANDTDGYLEAGEIKLISEFKYDLDFTNNANVARVLIQVLYYIKNRQKLGQELPSSIFVGDMDEYFIVSVKQFSNYLTNDYINTMDPTWSISPSSAYKLNTALYQELYMKDIPLMIKPLGAGIDKLFVKNRLTALASNENIKTKLNSESIKKPFYYFTHTVLNNADSIEDHAKIQLFFSVITGNEDVIYKRGKIRYGKTDYPVNDNYYAGFVNVYQTTYKSSERESFISNMDSLIQEEARRFNGAFFTPKVIVDYAHETISKNLGEDWRDEYVVWDPAAGTLNLTRDYHFKELYSSTLFQEELDLAEDYNPEGIKFQYDFLNDDFTAIRNGGKVPNGLYDAINDPERKVMILMNPPYAAPGTGNGKNHKTCLLKNCALNKEMKQNHFDKAAQQMYTYFLYRINKISKMSTIAAFTMSEHLRKSGQINYAKWYLNNYEIIDGFLFDSKYFEGAAGGWPVLFSVSKQGITSNDLLIKTIELDREKNIKELGNKEIYTINKINQLSKWIRRNSSTDTLSPKITLSMPTTLKKINGYTGNISKNSLGYINFTGNSIKDNKTNVSLYSTSYSNGHGTDIIIKNLYDVVVAATARMLIKPTVFTAADDYNKPDETHPKYEQFKYDSLIYSLFNSKSLQSSLRNVGYDAKCEPINYPTATRKGTVNVYNEWYFLSLQETSDLADTYFPEVYQDAKGQKDRYVYTEIERIKSEYEASRQDILDKLSLMSLDDPAHDELKTQLEQLDENYFSPEALDVLEAGRKLYRDTFYMRATLHTQYPEYHLNTWDCGYWQLRTALKKAGMEHLMDDINAKYKILEDKMRPLVYELGFLKA